MTSMVMATMEKTTKVRMARFPSVKAVDDSVDITVPLTTLPQSRSRSITEGWHGNHGP